ncbi:MAG TPA: hypothetical protein VKG44_03435, partial [Candidatus Baltobacteraceae bacterium]|nr:hypothetical protein [Candidatus Baltobacteraceae bacterium]
MSTTRRPCDLVMKGGVTSGVVYPAAVYQISRAFDLKSIGGTSAGAIAAALAAAAQYRRIRRAGQSDAEAGYERLAQVPDWLGSDGHLLGLFAPNRATQKIFETILDQAEPGGNIAGRLVRFVKRYALAAVLGAVPGAFYALAASQLRIRYALAVHELVALGVIAFGALACATAAFALD